MKKSILTIIIIAAVSLIFCGCTQPSETWRLGDYKGEYIGFRLEDEDSENPIIVIRFEFTNYSDSPASFEKSLSPALYQNGSELVRLEDDINAAAIEIAPNETHSMDLRFYLLSKNELVEITITNPVTGQTYSVKTHCQK